MLTKSDKTRQHIIEQSAVLFNIKGYAATSMADILEATRLAKGGVYGHFASKEEIAVAAFEYSYHLLMTAIKTKTAAATGARNKLFAILAFYRNYTIAPLVPGGCILLNTAVDADDNIPFLKEKAKQALCEMLGALQRIMQMGIDNKDFVQTLDAKKEAELFFALIEGGIMMAKLNDEPAMLNRMLDHLKHTIQHW